MAARRIGADERLAAEPAASTTPSSVPIHERLGFRSTGVRKAAPGVVFRSMLREAVA